MAIKWLIDASYFVAAILFILGLKGMSSPVSARKGIVWAGVGMVLATVVTFLTPGMNNFALMVIAIALGGAVAWVSGKKVAMTDMPQMVAIYNGMGGGAAAAIAAVEFARGEMHGTVVTLLATLGALIGAVSFSGSVVAWAKLAGGHEEGLPAAGPERGEHRAGAGDGGRWWAIVIAPTIDPMLVGAFFVLALVLGIIITLPIGGADMPVVISLFNAFTGLAVGFEGFVMGIPALIIAGIVVGAAGTLLTQLMAKAMNRPISNILFTPMTGAASGGEAVEGEQKESRRHGCGGPDALRQQGHHRAGLRHGGGRRPAQGVGDDRAAGRGGRRGGVCDPPGGGAHARPHERAAGRGRCALRQDLRPGRDQR
jgi:NAD(P) transhydrogenase subunit beta